MATSWIPGVAWVRGSGDTWPQDPYHLLQSVDPSVPRGAGVVVHMPHLEIRVTSESLRLN